MIFAVLYHRMALLEQRSQVWKRHSSKNYRAQQPAVAILDKSLNYLSRRLCEMSMETSTSERSQGERTGVTILQQPAPRFNVTTKKTQFQVDHSILDAAGVTGAIPVGRGAPSSTQRNVV